MKKLMLFASLAMAASAFAVPSTASAIWTQNHAHIQAGTNPQIHGEGTAAFTSPVGGVDCVQVTATAQLTGGSTTAQATQFNPTLESCKGTGGLAQCKITSITVENLPWTGHLNGTFITMTDVTIQNHFHGVLCPPTLQLQSTQQHHAILQGEETGKTEGHATITGLKIAGQLRIKETNQTAVASGTLTPTPATDSHKYGWT